MTPEQQLALAAEAALAPSTHNVQPARWRFDGDELVLFEDRTRSLPAGDPTERDAALSLGAAAEGMAIALSGMGYGLVDLGTADLPATEGDLRPVRRFTIRSGGEADSLRPYVPRRRSHRGRFVDASDADRTALAGLAGEDITVLDSRTTIARIAALADRAGHGFFRDDAFRRELLGWMRLRRSDPRWSVDGLNAEAMAMSPVEAWGARLVLGPLFRLLDRIGLAARLSSEAATVRSAAGLVLIHRPAEEAPFDSGRAFYRAWLRVTEAGLDAAVMAVLNDDPATRGDVLDMAELPPGRALINVLRVGRAPPGSDYPRARIAAADLLV